MPQSRPETRAAREPLTTHEFKRALEQGLGRAILCLQKHDPEPYKHIILESCLKDTKYDAQCEGSRVPYLIEAIDLTGDPDFFFTSILEAYPETPAEIPEFHIGWLEQQFSDFALSFARRGSTRAQQLLYESFAANPEYSRKFALDRDENIIELDGLDGLSFVLQQYARVAKADADFDLRYWSLSRIVERYGAEVVQHHIEQLCLQDPDIGVLVERGQLLPVSDGYRNTKKRPTPRLSYAQMVKRIRQRSDYPGGVANGAKWVTHATLQRLARDLLQRSDPKLIRSYLYAFRRRKFPFSLRHLLKLARHKNEDVNLGALIALQQFQHPKVRALALELRHTFPLQIEAIGMLESNYEIGDAQIILETIQVMPDNDHIHWLGYRIRDIYNENHVPEALEPLLAMYELNPCSICREDIITQLHEIGILPDWLLEEAQWDSYSYTREKARAWVNAA